MNKITIILLVILAGCNSKQESKSLNKPTTLVFLGSRGSGFDLYRQSVGDSSAVKITQNPGWDWRAQPVSGGMIVYNSADTSGNMQIRKMDGDGKAIDFNTYGLSDFTISGDGNSIIYSRKSGDATNLIIAQLNNLSDSLQITNTESYNGRPIWSPDGKKIAYISDRSKSNEIYIYDLNDRKTTQLTSNDLREKYMCWSPDGNSIATTMQKEGEENDIYQIELSKGAITRLTDTPINESEINWSPDAKYIVYHAQVNEKDDIYLLEIESGGITKVTNGEGYHGEPVFLRY